MFVICLFGLFRFCWCCADGLYKIAIPEFVLGTRERSIRRGDARGEILSSGGQERKRNEGISNLQPHSV